MSTTARKQRKRAGVRFTHPTKTPTYRAGTMARGLGLTTGAEILASIVVKGL